MVDMTPAEWVGFGQAEVGRTFKVDELLEQRHIDGKARLWMGSFSVACVIGYRKFIERNLGMVQ